MEARQLLEAYYNKRDYSNGDNNEETLDSNADAEISVEAIASSDCNRMQVSKCYFNASDEQPSCTSETTNVAENETDSIVILNSDNTFPVLKKNIENEMTVLKKLRKRLKNVKTWKRFKQSSEYNVGILHRKSSKENGQKRKVRGQCANMKCKKNCAQKIDLVQQQIIHSSFWKLGERIRRLSFLNSNTKRLVKKRNTTIISKSRRTYSLQYFLPNVDNELKVVCKTFFLNTLDISAAMVQQTLKQSVTGIIAKKPKRIAANKTTDDKLSGVRKHIEKFPRIESHYCRLSSTCEYLESTLSIQKMYELYKRECEMEMISSVKENVYRNLFLTEYNLKFHAPIKDACDTCSRMEMKKIVCGGVLPSDDEHNLKMHLLRKEQARDTKNKEKENPSPFNVCVTMDLQQVLTVPKLAVGSAYYLRKLNMYNMTVYDIVSKEGFCYTWTEHDAARGANEISSCVFKYLCDMDMKLKKQIIMYSDTCAGQNRNRVISTMILLFLHRSAHVDIVEQRFFESGHSQMECDSIHSSIQKKCSKEDIYLPSQYQSCIRIARAKQPYSVQTMDKSNIFDFQAINTLYCKANAFSGIINKHHIIYTKEINNSNVKNVRITFSDHIYGDNMSEVSYNKRGRNINFQTCEIPFAYVDVAGIDANKKDDLLKLCAFIPADCRPYYESLVTKLPKCSTRNSKELDIDEHCSMEIS